MNCCEFLELIHFGVRKEDINIHCRNVQSSNICMDGAGCFCGQVSEPHGECFLLFFFAIFFHMIHFKDLYALIML